MGQEETHSKGTSPNPQGARWLYSEPSITKPGYRAQRSPDPRQGAEPVQGQEGGKGPEERKWKEALDQGEEACGQGKEIQTPDSQAQESGREEEAWQGQEEEKEE